MKSPRCEGIRYTFQTTRETSCGPRSTQFVRYIFHNTRGEIECLGGFGEIAEVDKIVLNTLKIE